MLDEGVASAIMIGGVTGAGLVLAIYALMTPIIEKMFVSRSDEIKLKKNEFYEKISHITLKSPKSDLDKLSVLKNEINSLSKFRDT